MMTKKGAFVPTLCQDIMAYFRQHPYISVFILGAFVGFLVFLWMYGWYFLLPTNTDWLDKGGDLEQHYAGWALFRNSPWTFPVGMISQLPYPLEMPITYMDSIPLLAIAFKILSPVLPSNFQYIGLWGLIIYMLQGGLGALIVRKFTNSIFISVISSLFFIISPLVLARVFIHTALASFWLILLGISLVLYREEIHGKGFIAELIVWTVFLALIVLIHPYYIPIAGVFWLTYIIIVRQSDFKKEILLFAVPLFFMFVTFAIIGGFSLPGGGGAEGLDSYGLNLASLVDTMGWSKFVPAHNVVAGESMMYLGLGVIFLSIMAIYIFVRDKVYVNLFTFMSTNKRVYAVIIIFFLLIVASLGTRIRFGMDEVIDLRSIVPQYIQQVWATFRTSARLFWPVYFLLIVASLGIVIKSFKSNKVGACAVICIAVVLQVYDVAYSPNGFSVRHNNDCYATRSCSGGQNQGEQRQLSIYLSNRVAHGARHVVFISEDGYMTPDDFYIFDNALVENRSLTLNNGYFARMPKNEIERTTNEAIEIINKGRGIPSASLFVTKQPSIVNTATEKGYNMDKIGGYWIIRP